MIAAIILGCYAVAWLFTARLLFARWRQAEIGSRYCETHGSATSRRLDARYPFGTKPVKCCLDQPGWADWFAASAAAAAALIWPAVILAVAIRFRPPATAAERAAENAKLTKRITELERELDLPPGGAQ